MTAAPFGYGKVRASFIDIGLLIGRLTIAFVVFMHGWQKFTQMGYGGVVEMLNGVGAPIPQISAALLIFLEMVGSVALALGVFTRVVAVLMALNMTGAMLLLHLQNGFFVADGGYELVLMIGGASLIYAFAGAGRLSIDAIFLLSFVRRGKKAAAAATAEAGEMLNGLKEGQPEPGSPKPVADAGSKPEPKTTANPPAPRAESPKAEAPNAEAPKTEAHKAEAPKAEAPKSEVPKSEEPKVEAPKVEARKAEAPKAEASKVEGPKAEALGTPAAPAGPSPTPETDGPRHQAPADSSSELTSHSKSDAATVDAGRR